MADDINALAQALLKATGQRAFTVAGPRPAAKGKEEVEAARSSKKKTYRALAKGVDYKQGVIQPGEVFTTDQPQGSWMEEVETSDDKPKKDKKG